MRLVFTVSFAALLVVSVSAIVLPAERASQSVSSPGARQPSEAALAGLEWLLSPEGNASPSANFSTANKLYRVVSDESLVERLLAAARKWDSEIERREVPGDLSNRKYLFWGAVDPLVKQIIRERCAGEENPEGADRLAAHIREHHAELVGGLPLNRRIVAAYYVEQAGMDCCGLFQASLSALRAKLADSSPETNLANDPLLLYAVTHVLFTRSGYYDRYLDAQDFEPELAAIQSAASSMAERGLLAMDVDIAAELLVALKLLRAPSDTTVEELRRQVVAQQNHDGSWNSSRGPSPHTTLVCTLALIDFTPELRGEGNIRCAP